MQTPDFSSTIIALSTPPGVGALAVLRLSGPEALSLADRLFRGKKLLSSTQTHTVHYGLLESSEGAILDEVVATVFKGPRSYTGEDVVEISIHGSPFIQQTVLQAFLHIGARLAQPGEYTLRAFMNGRMDLSQAEAVADLIASESETAHRTALQQLRGGVRSEIAELRQQLLDFASLVELELDFSEEDVEFADRSQLRILVSEIRSHIQALLQSFALGNALRNGVSTVIAGRPNAGKSTLLNALLREERAIVSDIPGTTRDTVEEVLNIKGIPFRLVDTAGIREAQDQIEAIGVARTMDKVRNSAVLLYMWDVSAMTLADVHSDLEKLLAEAGDVQYLVLCNKMDRNPYFQPEWLVNPAAEGVYPYLQTDPPAQNKVGLTLDHLVTLSAKNEQNTEYLKDRLYELVAAGFTRPEATVVTNARHFDALQRADDALAEVLQGLEAGVTGDFVAQDIRRALAYLGEITGEIGVEDLLGNIFGRFCIGK